MDIHEKIKNGDYEPQTPYPQRNELSIRMSRSMTPAQLREYADLIEQHEAKQQERKEKLAAYNAEVNRLELQFKADCIAQVFGDDDYTKFPNVCEWCWYKAWDDGHSGGYSEVYNHLLDYAELIDAIKADISVKE